MEYDVYVVQIITSGANGFPDDEVVDIGICGLDLERMEADSVYSMTIRYDVDAWPQEKRDYLAQSGITADMVRSGAASDDVSHDVKELLNGGSAASFDIRNVFYRYMVNEPWDLTKEVSVMPSICSRLPASQRCISPPDENEKILYAYGRMFPDSPADLSEGPRALDYALMSSAILMELRKKGRY